MRIIQYILISSFCLSLFYLLFRLMFRNETRFKYPRLFLAGSIVISLLFPLNTIEIQTGLSWNTAKYETISGLTKQISAQTLINNSVNPLKVGEKAGNIFSQINWIVVLLKFYRIVFLILLSRICFQLVSLTIQYFKAFKIRENGFVLLYNHKYTYTFSFFKWIFVYPGTSTDDEQAQIIAHEKIHAEQYHSFDLITMELLAAVMWFNPLIRMMKNSVQLVHEYLADEGALGTGIDRLKYQALLINLVTEERLICLSSGFNPVCIPGRHSLIKKRMIMMKTSKINQRTKLKLLTLVPLSVAFFFLTGIFNGLFSRNTDAVIVSDNTSVPADTVKKVIVTKHINNKMPHDTIITRREHIEIIEHHPEGTAEKTIRHEVHPDKDTSYVYVFHSEPGVRSHQSRNLKDSSETIKHDQTRERVYRRRMEIRDIDQRPRSNILYIIDGKPSQDIDPLSTINVDDVKSIEVIKSGDISKYTSEDYDGIILVTSKNKKDSH